MRALATLAALVAFSATASALPPPGSDPNSINAQWFREAKTPDCQSCCDVADGRIVKARRDDMSPLGWAVLLDGVWTPIPEGTRATRCTSSSDSRYYDEKPVEDYPPHPAGSAVVWIWDGHIRCFTPPGFSG